jgi:hypothetical protein
MSADFPLDSSLQNNAGEMPLDTAVESCSIHSLGALIGRGAKGDWEKLKTARDSDGNSLLHRASMSGIQH